MAHSAGLFLIAIVSALVGVGVSFIAQHMKAWRLEIVFSIVYIVLLMILLIPEFKAGTIAKLEGRELAVVLLGSIVVTLPFMLFGAWIGNVIAARSKNQSKGPD